MLKGKGGGSHFTESLKGQGGRQTLLDWDINGIRKQGE